MPVAAGESALPPIATPGRYEVELDLVDEGDPPELAERMKGATASGKTYDPNVPNDDAGIKAGLGDKAEVQLVRVDLERRQLDFALVDVLARTAAGARKGRPPAPSRRDAPRAPRHPMKGRRR